MTDAERFDMIYSLMPVIFTATGGVRDPRVPASVPQTAGWVQGVPRLGVPDLLLTDAGLGITNPQGGRPGDSATALPSAQSLASTFNPALAHEAGVLLGKEARMRGFNVLLGGGINLARDPRHGRNFEYYSEDPLLTAEMVAATVNGTQEQGVVGILKHASLNSLENNKWFLDARIDPAAHRESDLLAFEIAIERSNPGSVMCAYNKVNGKYACGNDPLLNGGLKKAMGYKGWIMSDWKAVYAWEDALHGLDQQSGAQLDEKEWFVGPLRQAFADGKFPKERLSDMVRRILRAIYVVGADKWGPAPNVDMAAHRRSALETARQGIVLLKNDGALPLPNNVKTIAVIGGFANIGVMGGGGGSSQVDPPGGFALRIPLGGEGVLSALRRQVFIAPGPMAELRKLLPGASIIYNSGEYPIEAAALARRADVAIVVANKFETEGFDSPDLTLPWGQDALIAKVAQANPKTIVVLQTGNAVDMPWRNKVNAIVEAWYPGEAGGQAIAEVLTGAVNPSGRLPVSFVSSVTQTPHPELPGFGKPPMLPDSTFIPNKDTFPVDYHEGAEIGYRWLAKKDLKPNYAFGHGLSYTSFKYSNLQQEGGKTITASFMVTNTGSRRGADVPQLYLTNAADGKRMRLLGFERVELNPGESRRITLKADPRLVGHFDGEAAQWRIAAGSYRLAIGKSASELPLRGEVTLQAQLFGK